MIYAHIPLNKVLNSSERGSTNGESNGYTGKYPHSGFFFVIAFIFFLLEEKPPTKWGYNTAFQTFTVLEHGM